MATHIDDLLRAKFHEVDRKDQRTARQALRRMVATGRIDSGDLDLVATHKRMQRKSLQHITVADLIRMGIVTVGAVA